MNPEFPSAALEELESVLFKSGAKLLRDAQKVLARLVVTAGDVFEPAHLEGDFHRVRPFRERLQIEQARLGELLCQPWLARPTAACHRSKSLLVW